MIAMQTGRLAASVHSPARPSLNVSSAPPHYLRRLARFIVLRAALAGRLSWPVALTVLARLEVQS